MAGEWVLIRAAESEAARAADAVSKADTTAFGDQQVNAIFLELERRAANLGLRLKEGAAQKLAEAIAGHMHRGGEPLTEEEVDVLLRAQSEPEASAAPMKAAPSMDELAEKACEAINPGDPRNQWASRTVALQARNLAHRDGLSDAEAVAQVAKRLLLPGSPTSRATKALAAELVGDGMNADQAMVEAAQAMSQHLRGGSGVSKADDPSRRQVAETVKAVRVTKGLTQEALAKEIGVTPRQVCNWESGESVPDPDNAFKLAGVLDLSPEVRNELGRLLREARSRAK